MSTENEGNAVPPAPSAPPVPVASPDASPQAQGTMPEGTVGPAGPGYQTERTEQQATTPTATSPSGPPATAAPDPSLPIAQDARE
ncbi:protease, partial [Streptomyces sp. NPDC001034]